VNNPFRFWLLVVAALCTLAQGCATRPNTVTQFSSIDALLAGAYDGELPCRDLLRKGDLGIGTFDKLDGEMVVLDGQLYQVRGDGKVYSPDTKTTTPFATVINFKAGMAREVPANLSLNQLESLIDKMLPHTNLVCAIRLRGSFRQMKTRAVPGQTKPYRPLTEITKGQPEFDLGECTGTLVGFRLPGFIKGLNVPGYHLHFITSDRKAGGHVLGFTLASDKVELAASPRFELLLPANPDSLANIDFSRDRSADLEKVEKQQK
jgi:acetolactate decarboxylase